ncbi:MAG: hypothetical protein LBU06_09095 [Desulfovibrio sp.]|jgi:hypothetical protein|nr:hypothetical protein [Desulfovibrio sp.]
MKNIDRRYVILSKFGISKFGIAISLAMGQYGGAGRADASYCVSLRRCAGIARSRRLRKEQGGFAAAANLKGVYHNILN